MVQVLDAGRREQSNGWSMQGPGAGLGSEKAVKGASLWAMASLSLGAPWGSLKHSA